MSGRVRDARSVRMALTAGLALLLATANARAEFLGLSADEENDSTLSASDQHYSQGLRLSATWSDPQWRPLQGLFALLPMSFTSELDSDLDREYSLLLGQSIFTPNHVGNPIPDPADRPYAGWLYAGLSLMQQQRLDRCGSAMLESFELELGVVGPASQAEEIQIWWHGLFGFTRPAGWQFQLKNEPGVVVSYERRIRYQLLGGETFGLDVIPEVGLSAGNVLTYGDLGAVVRLGFGLDKTYGPARIRPSQSGTDWFDNDVATDEFGAYIYAGFQTRFVARNIFLDGNSWEDGPRVDREPVVADLVFGASAYWATNLRLDVSLVHRSKEFKGQPDPDTFAAVSLSTAF